MIQRQDIAPVGASWEVEQLRITTFHAAEFDITNLTGQWEQVFRNPPEQQTTRPREGATEIAGIIEGQQVVVTSQHRRVNVLVLPGPEPLTEATQGLPTLGIFTDAVEPFTKTAALWLTNSQPITRLAFGAVLVHRVSDMQSGQEQLSRYLQLQPSRLNDSLDFLYQINRRRASRVDETISINRLTKWSIMRGGGVALEIGPNEIRRLASDSVIACRLELDMNTPAERSVPISSLQTEEILKELIEYGSEISAKGDVP